MKNFAERYNKLRQIKYQYKEHRVQYLLDMANHYAMENNITRETAIRELIIHEELRDTYQRINMKFKKTPITSNK